MDIEQFAYKVIEKIKSLPPEAKQTGPDSDLETSWDEYKEQIQYEEYESFNLFEDMIESMIRDMIDLEDDLNIEILHFFFKGEKYTQADPVEKRNYIVESVLDQIREIAKSEEIDYKKTIEFIQYRNDDIVDDPLIIVAEVLKKVGPQEFLIHAYSRATGPRGEQGIVNMTTLEEECLLEVIDIYKFNLMRQGFHPTPSGRTRKDLPKGKRESSLKKHLPELSRRMKELRLKAEAMGQKSLQQEEESEKRMQDKLRKKKGSDSLNE